MFGLSKRLWMVIGGVVLVLVIIGLAKNGGSSAEVGSGSCMLTVTADALNVRDAPSLHGTVLRQLKHGTKVAAEQQVRNGYRKISSGHWAAQRFLKPVGNKC